MASSFTKLLTSRNTSLLLASLGAGTIAAGFLMRDNLKISAAERRKLYPPRYPHFIYAATVHMSCLIIQQNS